MLNKIHKGLRYLLLLPQIIIDIRSLLLFIGEIIHVPLVGDAEYTAFELLMVEFLFVIVPVVIGVHHQYVAWGIQAAILIALAISSHTNIISMIKDPDNWVTGWFVAWVIGDFVVWTDLYSYIRSKNDET